MDAGRTASVGTGLPRLRVAMDVEIYLKRIRYQAPPVINRPSAGLLRSLHRAHLFTVPFENLDIARRRKIVLEEDAKSSVTKPAFCTRS